MVILAMEWKKMNYAQIKQIHLLIQKLKHRNILKIQDSKDIQKMIIVIFNNHLLIKKKIYNNIKIKKFKKNKKFN